MEEPENMPEPDQRHLALEGSYNIRDIGGYVTLDGRLTRWRTFLRADSPNGLSLEGQRLLLAYPVRTILDLRRTRELRTKPSLFGTSPTVTYVNISLLEDEQKVREAQSLPALYRVMLETCQEQIRQIVQFLATGEVFPCLVHCTVGKDRTGLITALLLSIAKVPVQTIAEDYALSERYLAPLFVLLREQAARNEQDGQNREWLIPAHAETMFETLAYLEREYGSVKAYLRAIGITDEHLDRLARILVQ